MSDIGRRSYEPPFVGPDDDQLATRWPTARMRPDPPPSNGAAVGSLPKTQRDGSQPSPVTDGSGAASSGEDA